MADRSDITPELCRELLRYDPAIGLLYWRFRSRRHFSSDRIFKGWNSKNAGRQAFTAQLNNRCRQGWILKRHFVAHRVCWAIYTGTWPAGTIDHIDGDPTNNKIANLRDVSHAVNCRNTKRPTDNTSGFIGVTWNPLLRKWRAAIGYRGKHYRLGHFRRIEDAVAARKAAEFKFGFHPNHGRIA